MSKAGDNVTYANVDNEQFFAIVTKVTKIEGRDDEVIDLTVFGPNGPYILNGVKEAQHDKPEELANEYLGHAPETQELPAATPVAPAPTPLPPAPVAPVITDAEGEAWAKAHGYTTGPVPADRPTTSFSKSVNQSGQEPPNTRAGDVSDSRGQPEASTGSPTQQQAQQTPGGNLRESSTDNRGTFTATPATLPGN